ncbi:recombinase family protein [Pedobacter cryoconitis]|uniref:recombinase family protein n=1 Tax=Pedobacter cryoconitis TaxID=188932 RepID=UPI00374412C4
METKNNIQAVVYRDRRTHKLDQKLNSTNPLLPQRKVAYLYIRVSTDEQADRGFSQRDQDQRLHEYCERNDLQVGKVIYEDYSAKTFKKRPAWMKLLTELKNTKGRNCNMILFTKWDRFSRNTANAYNMIDVLTALNIEPNAIDQYLDLKVPESRIMLAVYIAMAEAENLRRGLNVVVGMRRGKLEGRWMGKAPAGYINRITENKTKYIELHEPEASHVKWAFETLAEGTYATDVTWNLARLRGMKCKRNTFWAVVRNPVYCGKIIVPPDEHTEMFLADGKHEPLISEKLFWEVQDILNGRRKVQSVKAETPLNLPLRGFLYCPICNRTLTGSPSKGRSEYYYYYHCKSPCKVRFKADDINKDFERELLKFVPKPGMAELYKKVICDVTVDDKENFETNRKRLVEEISDQNNIITKIRAMLLSDDLIIDDYKIMKSKCEEKITRLEAELKDIKDKASKKVDYSLLVDEALKRLKKLSELYSNGNIEQKRYIIGSIYPEKWTILENKGRTGKVNLAALLIYQINNTLRHKKTGVRTKIRTNSGLVPSTGVEPVRFPTGV